MFINQIGEFKMEDNSNEVEEKVIKDMSDKYNEDIANIQEQIDILKQQILINPSLIINLTERIQALYIKLHQKMKGKLTLGKVVILFFAGLMFAYGGLYYNKMLLSMGIFVLILASILLSMVRED